MRNKVLKVVAGVSLALAATSGIGTAAEAATVYYKGSAVSWDYGRSYGVNSYSSVQSGAYEHSATANTTFSGWKRPGVQATAVQYVGWNLATAYWNCRG
ncbi:MAG: hypothetical protein SPI83_02260 [Rothia sp. (in: high G+C Gram-positive bacteria)]|nr:hypothetical protein [Rothia sp. (in: high G+C Gram-positive bacteria)]